MLPHDGDSSDTVMLTESEYKTAVSMCPERMELLSYLLACTVIYVTTFPPTVKYLLLTSNSGSLRYPIYKDTKGEARTLGGVCMDLYSFFYHKPLAITERKV